VLGFGARGNHSPEGHADFRRKSDHVLSNILELLLGQLAIEALRLLELLDKSVVVIDLELFGKFQLTFIQDVFDCNDLLVVSNIIVEGYGSFEADERRGKVIKNRALLDLSAHTEESIGKANPRASRRINLVRLIFIFVFKMLVVLIDEVPNDTDHVVICPFKPIFNSWSNIKDRVTVKFSRIHFTNLVLSTMLSTVYTSKDEGVGVEGISRDLPTVTQFEDALTDFHSGAVNLIEEEDNRLVTSIVKPFRSQPSSNLAFYLRQSKKVTFGHLRSAAFDNFQPTGFSNLINDSGFTDTVATTDENGELCIEDERKNELRVLKSIAMIGSL